MMNEQEWTENDEIQAQARMNRTMKRNVDVRYFSLKDDTDNRLVPSENFYSLLERIRDENKH